MVRTAYRIFEFELGVPVTFELIGSRVHPEDLPLLYDMIAKRNVASATSSTSTGCSCPTARSSTCT